MGGTRVAIVGAARTPIGKFRGALARVPAVELGRIAVRSALERSGVKPSQVGELFFGTGILAGLGQNPARQVALGAGIGTTVGAVTVDMVCGSGMRATMFGATSIASGEKSLVVVGGMESMTNAPYILPRVREGLRYGDSAVVDSVLCDSLLDAYDHQHMGMTGEGTARRYGITREEADAFALESNRKAVASTSAGHFKNEIVPVPSSITGGAELSLDEGPRRDTTMEKLSKLRPVFKPDGVLTAGNSSQLSDGAAAMVLASAESVTKMHLEPLAWIHSYQSGGIKPSQVMEAPIPTVREHLKKESLKVADIDLFEHNEAFSTASIAVQRDLGIPEKKFNVSGGAIAMGHPIGCSGARILITLLYGMRRTKAGRGLATLCMGGGNGLSTILEVE